MNLTIPELVPVIREALADAIEYRHLPDWCADCGGHVGAARVLCATHEANFQRMKRYAAAIRHLPEAVSV